MWYHADYVMPYWGRVFERGPKIGRHIFYHGRKQRTQVAASQKAE
jgi:spore germination cell wall hydrolase CwlJ-like protein